MNATTLDAPVRYRVTGMDCSSCANKIEGAARKVAGVDDVRVSIASQEMTLRLCDKTTPLPELERTITDLGYQLRNVLDRLHQGAATDFHVAADIGRRSHGGRDDNDWRRPTDRRLLLAGEVDDPCSEAAEPRGDLTMALIGLSAVPGGRSCQ